MNSKLFMVVAGITFLTACNVPGENEITKNKILSRQFGNFSNGQGGAADRYAIMISNPRDHEKKGERKE